MAVNYSPRIVTDNLVLCLDAGNNLSYPGSGTTWTDLSGNSVNHTLNNVANVAYSSTGGGSLAFSTGIVTAPENSALNTQTPSVEVWIKTNAFVQNGFFFEKGNVNTQYSLFQEGSLIQWRIKSAGGQHTLTATSSVTNLNTTSFFHIVGTYTAGSRIIYVNGKQVASDNLNVTISTNTNGSSIGVYGGYNGARGYYFNGSIAVVKVYNKALSSTEVAQNFNALRGRFGL